MRHLINKCTAINNNNKSYYQASKEMLCENTMAWKQLSYMYLYDRMLTHVQQPRGHQ